MENSKITPGEVLTNIEWHLPGIWIKTKGRVGFLLGDIYTWAQSRPCVKTDRRRVDIPSAALFEVFQPFSVFSMRCKTAFVCCCWFYFFSTVRYVNWQVNVSMRKQIKDPNVDFACAASVFNRFYLLFISEPMERAENGKRSICVLTATRCCFSNRARVLFFLISSCFLCSSRTKKLFGKIVLLNHWHPQWFVKKNTGLHLTEEYSAYFTHKCTFKDPCKHDCVFGKRLIKEREQLVSWFKWYVSPVGWDWSSLIVSSSGWKLKATFRSEETPYSVRVFVVGEVSSEQKNKTSVDWLVV